MAREERREIEINASAERVWEVLTDFEGFPEWNPFIRSIGGRAEAGQRIEVVLRPPDARETTFRPTVLRVSPGHEFRWRGRIVLPGIFDGEHYFIIEPVEEGRVRFVQGERFTGILVPLFGGIIDKALRGFENMNQALKDRAESPPSE